MKTKNRGVVFDCYRSVAPSRMDGYLVFTDIDGDELIIKATEFMRMCEDVKHKRMEWTLGDYLAPISKDDFMAKYCNVEVMFQSYRNFSFEYKAILDDGKYLICYCGGNASSLNDIEINRDFKVRLHTLDPYRCGVYDNNKLVEWFFEEPVEKPAKTWKLL